MASNNAHDSEIVEALRARLEQVRREAQTYRGEVYRHLGVRRVGELAPPPLSLPENMNENERMLALIAHAEGERDRYRNEVQRIPVKNEKLKNRSISEKPSLLNLPGRCTYLFLHPHVELYEHEQSRGGCLMTLFQIFLVLTFLYLPWALLALPPDWLNASGILSFFFAYIILGCIVYTLAQIYLCLAAKLLLGEGKFRDQLYLSSLIELPLSLLVMSMLILFITVLKIIPSSFAFVPDTQVHFGHPFFLLPLGVLVLYGFVLHIVVLRAVYSMGIIRASLTIGMAPIVAFVLALILDACRLFLLGLFS